MKIGELDVSKIMLGSDEVEKVYLGTEQVYGGSEPQPTPYDEQYLTFVAKESGTFKFIGNRIDYSIDSGNTWTTLASDTDSPTVASGGTIMWKATLTPIGYTIGTFSSTGMFDVQGNVMSLAYGDNFSGQTTIENSYQFSRLFSGATHITSAENLVLPATTLAQGCYQYMFQGCTSLTTTPTILPATTLTQSCYNTMFFGCTSLTTAPVLPATTLANKCYYYMFVRCTSLTTAPELPATTLVNDCYTRMLNNCTSLNYIKCLATDISAASCTDYWVEGVSATGTFVKAASMNDWTTGVNGIPNGWTVENDDISLPVDNPIDDGGDIE